MTLSWLSAIAALLTVAASLPCTTNDYVGAYTSCRAPRYVRDAVFRWRSESTCNASEAGSATLPSNRLDLPCNVTCNGGFYLPVGNTACAECSAGTVALGGGVLISHWNSWRTPSDSNGNLTFSTRCEYNDNQAYRPGTVRGCQGWSLAGWNVRSGNISDYETSVLEVRVTLLRAGRVSFDYFVSAEDGYDGLLFLIDNANQIITSADAALPLVSDTPQLTNFNATLTAGTHVLTWRFFKDFLAADGDDMAYIKNLEIYGTAWADDSCAACPTGTYAPGRQLARCLSCPANSKAPNVGSSACIPCDADHEFSRPGATTCLTRALCVAQDYHVTRTLCQLDSEFEGGRSRLQTYQWLEPKLCDSVAAGAVALPSPSNVACQACAGGYRRPENITVCTACPTGQAGGGALNAPCVQCANGEAAVRQLKVAGEVSAWPQNMTTRCAGECAGSGWRLTDTGLDSGVGHGSDAVLTLTWIVDVPSLSPPPYIEFVSTIECGFLFTDDSCTLSFTVTGGNVTHPTITQSFAFRRTSRVYFLATGRRTMTWTFSKSITEVSDDAQRRYRAKLESILLVGANLGGAPTCVKCTGGSVSAAGSVGCSPCDAGTGPNPELTACVPCTQNQFAPDAGRGCRPCPNGTRRLSSTRCDDGGCQFRDNGRLYDLTPLRQNLPVEVKSGADKFQLYVCNSNRTAAAGNTSACVDQNGKPFDTYACQVLRSGVGVSLGDEVGFYTPARVDNMTRTPLGVIVRYAGGEPCVDLGIERSVNITFVCDPLAARGTPMPCAVGGVEPRKCEYCFEWRSLYGCPQCGELDRQQVFSECRLGLRRAFWQWRDDARCWGGALPPPTTVSCAQSSLSCPAGQRLPPGTTECLSCPNGTFSLGTGTEYYSFDQTLDLFRASSLPGVGSWTVRNASMHSSDGTSEMLLSVTYVTPGTVDFGYVMLGNNGTFKFLVDGAVVFTDRARPTPGRVARNITKGDVTFTWRFENGNATLLELSQLQKVIVFDVRTIGTEFASPDCDSCPLGTISRANATQCRPCFNNTVAANDDGVPVLRGATQCKACADSEFAYPGTTVCRPREPVCDTLGVHYDAYYTPCVGGQRTMFYSLLRRCVDTTQFDALKNVTEPCVAAPVCPNNQFLFVENGTCGNVPAGHVPVKSRIYLSKLAIAEPYLLDPSAFIFGGAGGGNGGNGAGSTLRVLTGCVAINHARAQCGGGWRARGQYLIDSGDHGDEWTDSLLVIRGANDTFVVGEAAGELQFDATFVDPNAPVGQLESTAALTALYVYYGNDLVATVTTRGTYTVPLAPRPLAEQNVTFRYHQWTLDNRTRSCQLGNVTFRTTVGVATGVRRCGDAYTPSLADGVCVPCPAGTSSVGGGACTPCTLNTFAPTPGSKCLPCGVGAVSARPPTRCFTTCLFTMPDASKKNRTYDLRELYDINQGNDLLQVSGHADSSFELSPCGAAAECKDQPNQFIVERARSGNVCRVVGSHLNFSLANSKEIGFNLDYTTWGVPTSECKDGKRVARVSFLCAPDTEVGQPIFVESLTGGTPDRCTATFVWVTRLGCPMCTDDDYTVERTECIENLRNDTLVRRTGVLCNGPKIITDPALAKTLKAYASTPLGTVECGETYEFPFYILVIVAVVVGCIILAIFGFFVSNRRIRRAYKKLREQGFN